MKLAIALGALVVGLLVGVAPVAAQTTNCTTTHYFDTGPYNTTCSTDNSYSAAMALYAYIAELEIERAYIQAATPASGIDFTINGQRVHYPDGTFVKGNDSPAIFIVDHQYLHGFSTWQRFLSYGGRPDLSNVLTFSTLSGVSGSIGSSVP